MLWNTIFTVHNGGNSRNVTNLNWVSRTGARARRGSGRDLPLLRRQPKEYSPPANPDNLIFQFLALTLNPADLQGTAALSWRYKDPGKRDASWAYVPALRRVRSVSPTNRSDGFLGSDLSQDDGNFFDGKPEDFVWKLVGRREALRFTDPDSLAGKVQRRELPGGGWRTTFTNNERTACFQVKDWRGVAWAPVTSALAKRNVWVIEGTPKDQYYLYGKIELWIDDYTYEGSWNRRFSWKNELLNTYQITAGDRALQRHAALVGIDLRLAVCREHQGQPGNGGGPGSIAGRAERSPHPAEAGDVRLPGAGVRREVSPAGVTPAAARPAAG